MKKKFRMYEDAKYQAERRGISCSDEFVEGYSIHADFWGKEVEVVESKNYSNWFSFASDCFDGIFESWMFEDTDDSSLQDDMFRHGKILTDERDLMAENGCVRIVTIAYNHKIYYVKMVNGKIEVLEELKA